MHNVWTLLQREYLERVRTRSFVIFTLLMPAFMAGIVLIPAKIAEMNSGGERQRGHRGQRSPDARRPWRRNSAAQAGKRRGAESGSGVLLRQPLMPSRSTPIPATQSATVLRQQVSDGQDHRLSLADRRRAGQPQHHIQHQGSCRLRPVVELRNAVRTAVTKQHLAQKGMSGADVDSLLDAHRAEDGSHREGPSRAPAAPRSSSPHSAW